MTTKPWISSLHEALTDRYTAIAYMMEMMPSFHSSRDELDELFPAFVSACQDIAEVHKEKV